MTKAIKYSKHSLNLFLFLFVSFSVLGQQVSDNSLNISQFVRNIPKTEYMGENQSWSITQDEQGIIYVANRIGVLEFNGINWKKYALKSSSQVRAVHASGDGKIYYGQFEDFGYLQRNENGELKQISISDSMVIPEQIENHEIWSISEINGKIYFKSFGKIFIYYNNKVKVITQYTTIYSLFQHKNKPCIHLFDDGLFYLNQNDELEKAAFSENLVKYRVIDIVQLNDEKEYVITEFNGLLIKENGEYIEWDCEANRLFKNLQINKCNIINDDLLAVGTIGKGLIIFNKEGKIISSYDKTSGLQSNTVLSFLTDKNNNLWAGLNGGIDFIQVNSPNLYCFDKVGKLGAVHCSMLYKNRLYFGTNQGLFYTSWSKNMVENKVKFQQVKEVKGQVWSLEKIDGKLFCNYNLGLLQINNEEVSIIGHIGGYTLSQHPKHQDILYQGNYTGILIFKKDNKGNWAKYKWLLRSSGGARFLNIDPYNNLWLAENVQNARLLRLNSMGDSLIISKYLPEENGFNPKLKVRIFDFEDRIVFSNSEKFFTYDYISESVKPYEWLNTQLGNYAKSNYIVNTSDKEYWFLSAQRYGAFMYNGDKLNLSKELFHEKSHYSIESDRQNIFMLNKNSYLIGHDKGFMIYTSMGDSIREANWQAQLKLVAATCNNEKGQITKLGVQQVEEFEIPFKYRNLSFTYAVPGIFPKTHKIFYQLDDNEWIASNSSSTLTFNYLPWGKHKLRVKVLDEKEKIISEISHDINIVPPYYLSIYAIILYLLFAMGIIYAVGFFNRYRLKKQKLVYLKKIKRDNTRRIIQLKNQYLKTEVQNKSAQLVNYTVLLGKKNEVLINIKELLDKTFSETEPEARKAKSKLYDIIRDNLSDKNDWKIFSAHFNEAHSNFLKKLKSTHEVLTPADLQLCAYLKMNLSSKEIASLLNISPRSVEVKRYRLRKKLNLEHDDNLVEYLLEK